METRLFVDVDDTLILYSDEGKHPYGILNSHQEWQPNSRLIAEIVKWHEVNPKGLVIVWSGGGNQYAASIGEQFFKDVLPAYFTKNRDYFTLET